MGREHQSDNCIHQNIVVAVPLPIMYVWLTLFELVYETQHQGLFCWVALSLNPTYNYCRALTKNVCVANIIWNLNWCETQHQGRKHCAPTNSAPPNYFPVSPSCTFVRKQAWKYLPHSFTPGGETPPLLLHSLTPGGETPPLLLHCLMLARSHP